MKLAVIPARGGSKRIPRKNVRPFGGRPMIGYAIETARSSALFDRVIVSTDDAEIAEIARGLGAEVPFVRPAALADDHTPTVPVVAHAIDACGGPAAGISAVCCIYPAVPLLHTDDLRRALALLDGDADYVFPVAAYPAPVQRALSVAPDGAVFPLWPEHSQIRTQDLTPAYHDAGQFYWGRSQAWLANRDIHRHGRALVLPAWRVIDIDTLEDWRRAEALVRAVADLEAAP